MPKNSLIKWKHFVLHSLGLSVAFFAPKLAKLVVYVLGARWLAAAGLGLFSYLHVMVEVFQHLFGAGLDNIAARYYRQGEDWRAYWRAGLVAKLLICGAGAVLALIWLSFPYDVLFALWFVLLMMGRIFYAYANTLLLSRRIILASAWSALVLVIGAVVGIKTAGVNGLLLAFVGERLTEVLILAAAVLKKEPLLLARFRADVWPKAYRIVRLSLPLWITQGFYILYSRLDALLVKQFLGYVDLARYALTYRIGEAPLFIFSAIADSSLAFFYRYPERVEVYYKRIAQGVFLLGLLAVGGLKLFARYNLIALLGRRYEKVAPFIGVYSWCVLLIALGMLNSCYLVVKRRERVFPGIGALVLLANLGGNLVFIPWWGVEGACLVSVLTAALNYILLRRAAGKAGPWDVAFVALVACLALL